MKEDKCKKDGKAFTPMSNADSCEKGEVKEDWLGRTSVCSAVIRKI